MPLPPVKPAIPVTQTTTIAMPVCQLDSCNNTYNPDGVSFSNVFVGAPTPTYVPNYWFCTWEHMAIWASVQTP